MKIVVAIIVLLDAVNHSVLFLCSRFDGYYLVPKPSVDLTTGYLF